MYRLSPEYFLYNEKHSGDNLCSNANLNYLGYTGRTLTA